MEAHHDDKKADELAESDSQIKRGLEWFRGEVFAERRREKKLQEASAVVFDLIGPEQFESRLSNLLLSELEKSPTDRGDAALIEMLPSILSETAEQLKSIQPQHAGFWETLTCLADSIEPTHENNELVRKCLVAIGTEMPPAARRRITAVFKDVGHHELLIELNSYDDV